MVTLLQLQQVDKLFGARPIFRGLSWSVEEGARIGLVGPNGAGKSTLLRIAAGIEEIDGGEIARKRGLRTAFLPQHVPGDDRTALLTVMAGRPDLAALEAELAACERAMGDPDVAADMRRLEVELARQERLLRRFEELGGPGFEGEARRFLLALGIEEPDHGRPTRELSGGQRKLVMSAACLARRPDLLLLDEPETHLDLPRRERLEELIRELDGAVVVVSHDRYLLDETVSEIDELENGRLRIWHGNYSAYVLARQLELQRQVELYASQQKEIARLEEAIRRFKLWASMVVNERHIRQARVKQRQIDRMEKVDRPVLERRKMALELSSAQRGGQKVLELRHVGVAFDGRPVILDACMTIWRGERVGIVGPNGTGKSVLASVLAGRREPSEGELWAGPSIRTGYFAQGNETLPPETSPLELVRNARQGYENQAVSLLLRFLFTYEQVRQPVRTLSGGERSRLQLLLLMLSGANCLVLDEPTNHLDIDATEVLEGQLEEFDGTVIVISHDRYFLDRIVDRTVQIVAGELLVREGGYSALHEAARAAS